MGTETSPAWLPRSLSLASLVVFMAVTLAPLAGAVASVFEEGDAPGLEEVMGNGRVWRLLGRSLIMAGVTSAAACLLGTVLGLCLEIVSRRLRLWAAALLALPALFSPAIVGVGWLWMLGPTGVVSTGRPWNLTTGVHGPAIILTFMYAPFVGFLIYAGRIRVQRELVLAARLYAGEGWILARLLLPLLAPYLATGGLVVFLLTFFSYSVPSFCWQNVLAVEVWMRFSLFFDAISATFLSFVLAFVGLLVLFALRLLLPITAYPGHGAPLDEAAAGAWAHDEAMIADPRRTKRLRSGAALTIALFVIVALGIPLLGQVTRFPAWDEVPRIVEAMWPSLVMTGETSFLGAVIAVTLAVAWALQVNYGRHLRGVRGEIFGVLPLALPGPLLGIGMIYLLNWPVVSPVFDTIYPLAIAKGVMGCPYAFMILFVSMRLIPRPELEAVALTRRSPVVLVLRRVLTPALCALLLCFCLSAGETDLALMLCPPGRRPLPVAIYVNYHFGAPGDVAVLSCELALLTVTAVLLITWVLRLQWRRRRRPQ